VEFEINKFECRVLSGKWRNLNFEVALNYWHLNFKKNLLLYNKSYLNSKRQHVYISFYNLTAISICLFAWWAKRFSSSISMMEKIPKDAMHASHASHAFHVCLERAIAWSEKTPSIFYVTMTNNMDWAYCVPG
jgi:hypothetical protein